MLTFFLQFDVSIGFTSRKNFESFTRNDNISLFVLVLIFFYSLIFQMARKRTDDFDERNNLLNQYQVGSTDLHSLSLFLFHNYLFYVLFFIRRLNY